MMMPIQKKYIVIFAGIFLLLFLGGLFLLFKNDIKEHGFAGLFEGAEKNSEQSEMDKLVEKTVEPVDEKMKGFSYVPPTEDSCREKQGKEANSCLEYLVVDKAFAQKDANKCLTITDVTIKKYCLNKIARNTGDVKICKLFDDAKFENQCFSQMAFLSNDQELCKNDNEFMEKKCMGPILAFRGSATGKIEECQKIDVLEYSGLCIERMINNYNRDCRLFENLADRVICEDLVLYENAMETENEKLCSLISDETRRQVCMNILTKGKEIDSDGDNLSDGKEMWFSTNPFKNDTDGDGINDGLEMNKYETNPKKVDTLVTDNPLIDDYYIYKMAKSQSDCQGIKSIDIKVTCLNYVANPKDTDFDKDGLTDEKEIWFGTNPANKESAEDIEKKLMEVQEKIDELKN